VCGVLLRRAVCTNLVLIGLNIRFNPSNRVTTTSNRYPVDPTVVPQAIARRATTERDDT
jgi:hypothetical protein